MAPLQNVSLEGEDHIRIGNIDILSPSVAEKKLEECSFRFLFDEVDILESLQNNFWISVSLVYDVQEIHDEALIKIENFINILRLYTPLMPQGDRIKIGLAGTILTSRLNLLSLGKGGRAYGGQSRLIGPIISYKLTNDFLMWLRENLQLDEIEEILLKEPLSLSKLERQILLAIRWIGMGLHDDINSDKFIKFIIALEALILLNGESKSEALAERSAYILEHTQKDRLIIYNKLKKFYDIRSEIVHEGRVDIDNKDVEELSNIAIKLLKKLLTMRKLICDLNDLKEWVDLQIKQSRFQ